MGPQHLGAHVPLAHWEDARVVNNKKMHPRDGTRVFAVLVNALDDNTSPLRVSHGARRADGEEGLAATALVAPGETLLVCAARSFDHPFEEPAFALHDATSHLFVLSHSQNRGFFFRPLTRGPFSVVTSQPADLNAPGVQQALSQLFDASGRIVVLRVHVVSSDGCCQDSDGSSSASSPVSPFP